MEILPVNYLAVIVAALAYFVLGGLWYSPVIFGRRWMKMMHLTEKDMEKAKEKGMAVNYIVSLLAALVTACVLAHIIEIFDAHTVQLAMQTAFWLWLGFVATTSLDGVLWESKPLGLYLINNSYRLLGFIVMALIIGLW